MPRPTNFHLILLSMVSVAIGLGGCGANVSMARTGPVLRPWTRPVAVVDLAPPPPAVEVGIVSADALSGSRSKLLVAMQKEAAAAGANTLVVAEVREDREHHEEAQLKPTSANWRAVDATRREVTAKAYRTLAATETVENLGWIPPAERLASFRVGGSFTNIETMEHDLQPKGGMAPTVELGADLWPTSAFGVGLVSILDLAGGSAASTALDLAVTASVRWISPTGRVGVGFSPLAGVAIPFDPPDIAGQIRDANTATQADQVLLTPSPGLVVGGSLWTTMLLSDSIGIRIDLSARSREIPVEYRLNYVEQEPWQGHVDRVDHMSHNAMMYGLTISCLWQPTWTYE